MKRLLLLVAVAAFATAVSALPAAAGGSLPSGEVIVGKTVVEPVYDDMTGNIRYVSTPMGAPNPVKSNPRAAAPFYLPVYPKSWSVGTLLCQDVPVENCPDHGPAVATASEGISASIFGAASVYAGGVQGHDHLMSGPGSGGDFTIAWVPTLVLFTPSAPINTHITTLAQLNTLLAAKDVIEVPLDGTNGTPNLTFHCSVVPAAVYNLGTPFLG